MKVILDGSAPSWVVACTDEVVRARLGAETYRRGVAYAESRAIHELTMGPDHRITAEVQGSGSHRYVTVVTPRAARGRARVDWNGRCSCPMTRDCKHVAAVILTARDWVRRNAHAGAAEQAPQPSDWQQRLAGVVRPPAAPTQYARVALQFELVTPRASAHGAPDPATRVRLRPVTAGKSGKWVRSGVGWRELEAGYSIVSVAPEQRAALLMLLAVQRGASRYAHYGEAQVHLDEIGGLAWPLLQHVRGSGVEFVGSRPSQLVQVKSGPADVVIDLRAEASADAHATTGLTLAIRVPDVGDIAGRDATLIVGPAAGAAPAGVFVDEPERLVLARFDRPLESGVRDLLAAGVVSVPAHERDVFFGRYYPTLRQQVIMESGDGSVELPELRPPHLVLQVRFESQHRCALEWFFGYPTSDDVLLVAPVPGEDVRVTRDPAAEQSLVTALAEDGGRDVPGLMVEGIAPPRLLPRTELVGMATASFAVHWLPLLDDLAEVQVSGEVLDYGENVDAPLISVSAGDRADSTDWFDLGVKVSVAGQEVDLPILLAALTLRQETLLLDNGTWFSLNRPELNTLRRLLEEAGALQDRESRGLRLTPLHAGLWEELVELGVVTHESERWQQTAGALLALDSLPRPEVPRELQATLRPYQVTGFQWLSLLWDHQLGGILADDMGLGKTVQTLAMVAYAHAQGSLGGSRGPLLVVAPTSVVSTWAAQAAQFVPDLVVVAITETDRRSGQPLGDRVAGADVVVTSYALFRIDEDSYRDVSWCGLVLDEAQFVKNHQARTYQCARRLPAPFKLAITGTPLENSLMDLWSMLSITAPGLFPSPQRFTELFRRPIESGQAPEQLAALRRRIRPLMLRRTKDQVALDLPPKVEQVLEVTLNPAHRKVYDKHLARERQRVLGLLDDVQRNRIAIFRSLTLLRQLSLDASLVEPEHAASVRSSKIDVLLEHLRELAAEGHRVLVFSQFTSFLSLVRSRLVAEGIGHCYLDGRTRDRPKRIAEFTQGDAPVFLISLKAGGVGLTLTEADYVFVLDPWWNPATEAQAVDRAHRIGQTKTVMVYRLVAQDTIEEKVVALQQRKRDLFAQVVEDDAVATRVMTADDFRGLFD